ncbi:hypothetical protein LPJ75_003284, partial [Coemansia sp. RSA 2598]
HVLVAQQTLHVVERIEVHYRGVEVIGGTLEDFDDASLDGLQPRKGVRALSRLYFDERLVLWQKHQQPQPTEEPTCSETKLPFSIAFPSANYPTAVKSICRSAPSQSFEIAYHISGWLIGANDVVAGRVSQSLPFVPLLVRPPTVTPQTPVTRTAYDDRGKEVLVTRVTLSQSEYLPNDQVVGGVYMELTKSNRTIRKAECQLRQWVECRMRRTFSSAETAEIISNGSRPNSSQLSPMPDESDVLWCRSIEITPLKPLTLTATGVGLAAAAAAGCTGSGAHQHSGGGGASTAAANNTSVVSEHGGMEVAEKRESSASRALSTKSIISSNRSCSANFHIDIPMMTHIVPGHFLLFSYELLIDVTVYSLTRGTQKISTRTPLSSSSSSTSATPTSTVGLTLSRQPQFAKALAENHGGNSGSFSATATCFPPNILQGSSSLIEGREGSQLRGSRFSVGAFQSSSNASSVNIPKESLNEVGDGDGAGNARYSTFNAVAGSTIYRMDSRSSAENRDGLAAAIPNAVEQLRFKCDLSLGFVPKIFIPSADEDTKPADAGAVADSGSGAKPVETADGGDDAALPEKHKAEAARSKTAANRDSKIGCNDDCGEDAVAATFAAAAAEGETGEPDDWLLEGKRQQLDDDGASVDRDNCDDAASVSDAAEATEAINSGNSSEFDLARAVSAAAERVLSDKQWDRPASYYLANHPEADARTTSGTLDGNSLGVILSGSDGKLLAMSNNGLGDLDVDGGKAAEIAAKDCGGDELGDLDVEEAINELVPVKRHSGSTRSSLAGSSGMKDFIQGIDFFGAEDAGPELTGMLSADAGKLVFGVTLTSELL